MKLKLSWICGAVAAAIAMATTVRAAERDRHVMLITLDGFPAFLWRDPSVTIPHLRRLAAAGAVADAMTVANPSITWPNHTTLVTGVLPEKHGVLYNGLVTRQGPGKPIKIEPWVDKARLVRVPTVYDAAFHAGLTTAEIDWVAITRPGTITWAFAELVDPAASLPREMIAAGVATAAEVDLAHTYKPDIVWRDELWTRAAAFVFQQHHPNLLLFHPQTTDATHHRYGPGSLASHVAMTLIDERVGELVKAIDASGLRDRTTIIVTTDHGFKKVDRYVYPNVVLRQAGLLQAVGPGVANCAAFTGTEGGVAFVYITDPARKAELLPKVKDLFAHADGIARVLDASTDAHALGMPTPEENEGMGDVILYSKPGYAFTGLATGDAVTAPTTNYGGTHGQEASDPELDGIFIANGAGIRHGLKIPRVRNIDVAPTIAKLLGVELPTADGRPIEEILTAHP